MVRSLWKPSYVHYHIIATILKKKSKGTIIIKTMSRSSTILYSFIGIIFYVYTGRTYTKFTIEERMVGHKLGEFSFTRKIGKIHEKKNNKRRK